MISFILIFLAAASEAFMDTFIFRADRSVFKNIVDKVNPFLTYKTTPLFLGWMRFDPWHIAKLIRNAFIYFAVIFYSPVFGIYDVAIVAACWFIGFELFWGKILYRP